jgi:hypothetical protein
VGNCGKRPASKARCPESGDALSCSLQALLSACQHCNTCLLRSCGWSLLSGLCCVFKQSLLSVYSAFGSCSTSWSVFWLRPWGCIKHMLVKEFSPACTGSVLDHSNLFLSIHHAAAPCMVQPACSNCRTSPWTSQLNIVRHTSTLSSQALKLWSFKGRLVILNSCVHVLEAQIHNSACTCAHNTNVDASVEQLVEAIVVQARHQKCQQRPGIFMSQ